MRPGRRRRLSMRRRQEADLSGRKIGHLEVFQRCGHSVDSNGNEEWAHDVLCTDCGKHLIMRTRALLAGACCERRRRDDADRKKASRVWVKVWNWAGSSGIRLHIEAALKLLNRKPSGRRRTR